MLFLYKGKNNCWSGWFIVHIVCDRETLGNYMKTTIQTHDSTPRHWHMRTHWLIH